MVRSSRRLPSIKADAYLARSRTLAVHPPFPSPDSQVQLLRQQARTDDQGQEWCERAHPEFSKNELTPPSVAGYIHLISAPLLPPLTPLNTAFLFPQIFSTLTSGVQKIGLDKVLLPSSSVDQELGSDGTSMVQELIDELVKEQGGQFTVFAPTNLAFDKLG